MASTLIRFLSKKQREADPEHGALEAALRQERPDIVAVQIGRIGPNERLEFVRIDHSDEEPLPHALVANLCAAVAQRAATMTVAEALAAAGSDAERESILREAVLALAGSMKIERKG